MGVFFRKNFSPFLFFEDDDPRTENLSPRVKGEDEHPFALCQRKESGYSSKGRRGGSVPEAHTVQKKGRVVQISFVDLEKGGEGKRENDPKPLKTPERGKKGEEGQWSRGGKLRGRYTKGEKGGETTFDYEEGGVPGSKPQKRKGAGPLSHRPGGGRILDYSQRREKEKPT